MNTFSSRRELRPDLTLSPASSEQNPQAQLATQKAVPGNVEAAGADLTGLMRVYCAWCRRPLRTVPCDIKYDGQISDGICPECLAKMKCKRV
jgi:hypothetical protein